MIPDLAPWQIEGLQRALDYLRGGAEPGTRHLIFNGRRSARRDQAALSIAAHLIAGAVPYVRRPRHLAEGTPAMGLAAPRLEDAEAVLREGRLIASAYALAHMSIDPKAGRHEFQLPRPERPRGFTASHDWGDVLPRTGE
jgi:hypothetical protein